MRKLEPLLIQHCEAGYVPIRHCEAGYVPNDDIRRQKPFIGAIFDRQ